MVLFGIKVEQWDINYHFEIFFHSGESNCAHNQDKYACAFAKMIEYWRQIWNQRTNGNTDLQFPFGFVQVMILMIIILFIYLVYSYQQLQLMAQMVTDFHWFDGIKHLMLVMYQIILFRKYLWLLLWIYVMIQACKYK
jgi:hypothetical protein